jgi:hypothetical protein
VGEKRSLGDVSRFGDFTHCGFLVTLLQKKPHGLVKNAFLDFFDTPLGSAWDLCVRTSGLFGHNLELPPRFKNLKPNMTTVKHDFSHT